MPDNCNGTAKGRHDEKVTMIKAMCPTCERPMALYVIVDTCLLVMGCEPCQVKARLEDVVAALLAGAALERPLQ